METKHLLVEQPLCGPRVEQSGWPTRPTQEERGCLYAVNERLMLRQLGIEPLTVVRPVFGALVVAKVLMVVNLFPFVKPVPGPSPHLQHRLEDHDLSDRLARVPISRRLLHRALQVAERGGGQPPRARRVRPSALLGR